MRSGPESRKLSPSEGQSQLKNAEPEGYDVVTSDAWNQLQRQSCARLLQKVYEVDPFKCSKCSGGRQVVAVIEDPVELRKIIEWAQTTQIHGSPGLSV